MSDVTTRHVYRPTPTVGIVLGLLVVAGIALPGPIMAPAQFFAGAGLAILLICGAIAFGLVLLWRLRVELVRDDAARVLRFTRVRWPLAPVERTLPFDAIGGFEVERHLRASRVVIVMRDGERIPLVGGGSQSAAHEDTAAVLRQWIGG